ncbi:peptidylprolyl isomerase [Elysia marginata]|uniref:Peptidylprolyl isomerase n=1 Tax=Elysia marginata TaxID=1093978 RepID=A0AAV4ERK4_9GAST|nr:peptidylprolyl isomerase [Elysia marginata]
MADVFSGLDEEEISTRLKGALDLTQLRDPQGKGVEFELDEDHLNTKEEEPETSTVGAFDKNQVKSNICELSDHEDEEEEVDSDGEYLTEMQRLERRMKKLENSDITPTKDGGVLKKRKTLGVGSVIPEGSLVKSEISL